MTSPPRCSQSNQLDFISKMSSRVNSHRAAGGLQQTAPSHLLLLLFLCRPDRGQPLRRFPVSSAGFLAVRSSLALQQSITAEPDSAQVLGVASLPEPTGKNSARLLAAARSDSHALILRRRLPRHRFSSLTFCYHLGVRPRGTVEHLQRSPPSARFTPASCSRDGNLRLHKG